MTIIQQPSRLLDFIYAQKAKGLTIGFVPTMGALHQGHIALVNTAAAACDITVVSIFVNPTQFNDPADYQKYPDRRENDIHLLAGSGASVLFLPSPDDIYPQGTAALEHYDLGYLESVLEGRYRPGHFQGVCQVMARLLKAVQPHQLFMGQKDYQQCMVVKRLIALLDLQVDLITCPTIREADGLAMSSRNLRLDASQRYIACEIYRTLLFLKQNGSEQEAIERLTRAGFKVDYVELADADTLSLDKINRPVALVAAFLGDVRLIDNMVLQEHG